MRNLLEGKVRGGAIVQFEIDRKMPAGRNILTRNSRVHLGAINIVPRCNLHRPS